MKDILDKLSTYNLFNYLLPGILFVIIARDFAGYNFMQDEIFNGAFLYYFIGMVISRFGSLIVEPFLKKISFVKFADYKDFLLASKKDEKIDLLSEVNNSYRTFVSLFVILILLNLYSIVIGNSKNPSAPDIYVIITLLLIMFLFSYRKQTNYITKRIQANI